METRANFILIGVFTLAGIFGLVGLFLWFARVELDQRFSYYDVRFTSVSGLSAASDVRFSGLPVGQVVDVRLSPDRDGTILVRLEVDADTPVRSDSVATIESQGVTGVSYVLIGRGTPAAPFLVATGEVPEITAGRSVFQSLSEDAPQLVEETLKVVEDLGTLLGGENQQRFDRILGNVEGASETFAQTLNDFSEVAGTVTDFADQIGAFTAILDGLSDDLESLLQSADSTITSIGTLTDEARNVLVTGTDSLVVAQSTFNRADAFINEDLTETTQEIRATVAELRGAIDALSADAQILIETYNTTGITANARLTEAEGTLATVDTVLAEISAATSSVDSAAVQFETLLETDGAPLLAETRVAVADATRAIAAISQAATTDLPVIMADIRAAADTATRVITAVGADLSAASGRIDGLGASAQTALTLITETFTNANVTLSAINTAVETGDRTLAAAERAFDGADRVINEDLDGIISGLETSLASLNSAIGDVSADLPDITDGLRRASVSAQEAFADLQAVMADAGPAVADFTNDGLPLYTRLADETRALISNLDRLTVQIQRDPARFFLDQQSPEFQR